MDGAFMIGGQVYMRGLEREDLRALAAWVSDSEVTGLLVMGERPATRERLEDQWEQERGSDRDVTMAVCDRQNHEFIGTAGLYSISWIARSAELRVFLGSKKHWNRGIGTECTKLVVAYGFEKLNLNKVWLGVNAENEAAVRVYEKAGFVREGVLREEQYRNFRYYDAIRMSMLRSEYEQARDAYRDWE